MSAAPSRVLTIGHSRHSIERFLELLASQAITAVADVRSAPYSRLNPQFNRETLRASLQVAGIAYVFLGSELGARSQDPSVYVDHQVSYDRLAATSLFQAGLDRVVRGSATHRIALMCAEKEPTDCHRTILVSRRLVERGIEVGHVLADASVEPHEVTIDRLTDSLGIDRHDLFRTRDEILAQVYAQHGGHIAYTRAS